MVAGRYVACLGRRSRLPRPNDEDPVTDPVHTTAAGGSGAAADEPYERRWLALGIISMTVLLVVLDAYPLSSAWLVGILLVAAGWQVSPPRRRLLRRCGSLRLGAADGRAADVTAGTAQFVDGTATLSDGVRLTTADGWVVTAPEFRALTGEGVDCVCCVAGEGGAGGGVG